MEKFLTVAGVRTDFYRFHVISNLPANSGFDTDVIASPKLSLIFGPWAKTEYYINAGYGFHSNDGRGSTITVDPSTGNPVGKVTPLVRAKGAEVGARTVVIPHLQSEVTLWLLNIDSELIFAGDAGTTEASYPSHRKGIEWANYYTPTSWFTLDADFAYSQSRFVDNPAGNRIPGSPEGIISAGASIDNLYGFLGSLRLRYFGPRPLIEDNSVRSESSTLVDSRVGYEFYKNWRLLLDVFNIFNAKASDIDYYYTSRLQGEPSAGVNDIHTHPVDPREARLTLSATF
jgi:outer membrane receptor protein involved in Fe transport